MFKSTFKFLCLFIFIISWCQDKPITIQDSLDNKTYEDLNTLSIQAFDNSDDTLFRIYRNYHLKKAKLEKNGLETARAYHSFISWEDLNNDIAYCDSMIAATKSSTNKSYPTNGYLLKGHLYYMDNDYSKALENFITANDLAIEKKFKPLQIEAIQGIAAIKNVWGLHEEALEIYEQNYNDIISTPDYIINHYDDYMILANNLSLSFIRNQKPISALVITEKGMKVARMTKDSINYHDLGKIHATANFYAKHYPKALDSLLKFSKEELDFHLADSYYMIAKIYEYQGNDFKTIDYFKKIDSIHHIINEPFPELEDVYHKLYKYARGKDDKDLQLYYIDQLIAIDSTLDLDYADIGDKMRSEYDLPMLKEEKQILKNKLNNKQKVLIVTLVAILVLCCFVIYYYLRQNIYKRRLQELMKIDTIKNVTSEVRTPNVGSLGISEMTVKDILGKLEVFEQTKAYTITLHTLAKDFNTNSSYLSAVVNQVKQMNFANYLKDLRIVYAINSIKKDKRYLKYSIEGLAQEFGFSRAESFSKAFKDKTGVQTSLFLKELRKNLVGSRNL